MLDRVVRRPADGDELGPLAKSAGVSLGVILAALAALRRGKAFHPHGVVYDARLVVSGASAAPQAARLFAEPGEHRAVVRFSRAVGVPRPIPDLLGLAIRLPDVYGAGRHQDFLLVTSVDYPVLHHVFVPATDVQQRPYSSSLPYRAGGDVFLVGALPDRRSPRPPGRTELDRLNAAASSGLLVFGLAVAPLAGRFRPVAELRVGTRLVAELDALCFNPWNTGGGMTPAGWLNGARDRAYGLSQLAWRRARHDGAQAQDAADRRLESLWLAAPNDALARGRRDAPAGE